MIIIHPRTKKKHLIRICTQISLILNRHQYGIGIRNLGGKKVANILIKPTHYTTFHSIPGDTSNSIFYIPLCSQIFPLPSKEIHTTLMQKFICKANGQLLPFQLFIICVKVLVHWVKKDPFPGLHMDQISEKEDWLDQTKYFDYNKNSKENVINSPNNYRI